MSVFKVLKVQPSSYEVVCNLRDLPIKQLNLNYSNNDVQFHPKDGQYSLYLSAGSIVSSIVWPTESQLATAPTNGSVVIWDINKRTKNKLSECCWGIQNHRVLGQYTTLP